MSIKAIKTELKEIQLFRNLFLQENNFQIRYNACHERGWSDSWLLTIDDLAVGYGSVKGKDKLSDRDAIFEFYVVPFYRKDLQTLFSVLLKTSGVKHIECQSNDIVLSSLLYEFANQIQAEVILFKDERVTALTNPGVVFHKRKESDRIFHHVFEPVGEYVLEQGKEVVATGGFLLHYNLPFADLYMEVNEPHKGKGLASFLLQELKRVCYLAGRVPAARCAIDNMASRGALQKCGLKVSGYMLEGKVKS
jgi:GNAT superfamily N-acetyltransferase